MYRKVEIGVGGKQLAVSNLAEALYRKVGFTKGQVIDYYIRISHRKNVLARQNEKPERTETSLSNLWPRTWPSSAGKEQSMLPPLSASQWLLGSLAAIFLGMSKTGFTGVSLLGVALMAQVFPPRESTGVILPLLVFADLFAVTIFNRHALWSEVLRILPPAVFGVVIGFLIFQYIPSKHFGPTIGWMILCLVAWHFWRRRQANREAGKSQKAGENGAGSVPVRPHGRLISYWYGTLAGTTTMIANAAGPVMTVYLLSAGLAKYAFVGTSAWIFCLINLTKLPFSYALGVINRESLWFNAFMLPAVAAGIFTGRLLLQLIPQIWFERVLLLSAALAAVKLILS